MMKEVLTFGPAHEWITMILRNSTKRWHATALIFSSLNSLLSLTTVSKEHFNNLKKKKRQP